MSTKTITIEQPRIVSNVVKLTKAGLVKDKQDGLTNPEMAKKYGLSTLQISKALKMAGLEKTKAKPKPKFIFVPEESTTTAELTA